MLIKFIYSTDQNTSQQNYFLNFSKNVFGSMY